MQKAFIAPIFIVFMQAMQELVLFDLRAAFNTIDFYFFYFIRAPATMVWH